MRLFSAFCDLLQQNELMHWDDIDIRVLINFDACLKQLPPTCIQVTLDHDANTLQVVALILGYSGRTLASHKITITICTKRHFIDSNQ